MAVEIKELVIRAVVQNNDSGLKNKDRQNQGSDNDDEEQEARIVSQCVEKIMKIMKQNNYR